MTEPTIVDAPPTLYRVARRRGLLGFSTITPEDAELPTAGNRFDVAGGGVLYAGTTTKACYGETLARFRVKPKIRELLRGVEGFVVAGGVPRDWRLQRVIGEVLLDDPLPFLDLESPDTHEFLSERLSAEFVALGYEDNIDIADVCGRDRLLSREIARYAYTASDEAGNAIYSGIRYISRLDTEWECWAIFEGTGVDEDNCQAIDPSDPDLQEVVERFRLRLF